MIGGIHIGYFIVKKKFVNEDGGKKNTYQVSNVQIKDTNFPTRRLEKWEKLGWIEWHKDA